MAIPQSVELKTQNQNYTFSFYEFREQKINRTQKRKLMGHYSNSPPSTSLINWINPGKKCSGSSYWLR